MYLILNFNCILKLIVQARPLLNHALDTENFDELVDTRMGKNYIASEMFRMIEAAAACVRHSGARRPRMGQVVPLNGCMTLLHYVSSTQNGGHFFFLFSGPAFRWCEL